MQQLWARILAGEANSPGFFSKRTVNLLADLEKGDADVFTKLCGFCWVIKGLVPLVFDVEHEIYKRNGIHFGILSHLESLGLIQFENIGGYKRLDFPQNQTVFYFRRPVNLTFQHQGGNELPIGKVLFTRPGNQLATVCGAVPVEGFFDYVYDRWGNESLVPKRETEQ